MGIPLPLVGSVEEGLLGVRLLNFYDFDDVELVILNDLYGIGDHHFNDSSRDHHDDTASPEQCLLYFAGFAGGRSDRAPRPLRERGEQSSSTGLRAAIDAVRRP